MIPNRTSLCAIAFVFLQYGTAASAQSGLSLQDLGVTPAEVLAPAERLRECLEDARACTVAPRRGFSLGDVLNLGIVDRGAAPENPSASRSANGTATSDGAALMPAVLPSIDLSDYLTGARPAGNPRRSAELAELAAVLAEPVAQGLEVMLVVTGPDGQATQARASDIARVLESALGAAIRVETEPAEIDGLTLTLSLPGS
ncbi:MAG: hypothetical protein JJU07_12400 [Natronohydrobacter sp.]|nr:hypothetical protein [Natronohydrobacter sp.]